MGIAELRNLKGMTGLYVNEKPTVREPKAKKPIAKISEKAKIKAAEGKKIFELDKIFYLEIWQASAHKCQACGLNLGKEPLTTFFHHMLPKRLYPQFRHTHENIAILCPDCHSQCETDLSKVPVIKKRTMELMSKLFEPTGKNIARISKEIKGRKR